ncbi:MAG: hypothetical protein PT958_07635, partial [Firmicutes bacterium]|nr:hypothetical protein [Bacillota bacterium]
MKPPKHRLCLYFSVLDLKSAGLWRLFYPDGNIPCPDGKYAQTFLLWQIEWIILPSGQLEQLFYRFFADVNTFVVKAKKGCRVLHRPEGLSKFRSEDLAPVRDPIL